MDFFRNDETEDEPPKLRFRPCIAELMRTEYCAPSIILLVLNIKLVDVEGPYETLQAYRIWFGDGEKCIQGLSSVQLQWGIREEGLAEYSMFGCVLKKETHRFMITEETTVGSYVMLDEYDLRRSKRLNGKGEVAYLAIQNFHTVAQEEGMREREEEKEAQRDLEKQNQMKKQETVDDKDNDINACDGFPQSPNKRPKLHHDESVGLKSVTEGTDILGNSSQNEKLAKEDELKARSAQSSFNEKENALTPPIQPPIAEIASAGRKRRSSWLDEPSVDRPHFRQNTSSEPNSLPGRQNRDEPHDRQERRTTDYEDRYTTALHHTPLLPLEATIEADYPRPPPATKLAAPAQRPQATKRSALTQPLPSKPTPRRQQLSQPPPPLKPILRPLTLTPLSSLPTLPKKQNQLLDILALITTISPQTVKRPNMPLKRDIRLFDLSTSKNVALSVFVNADTFKPQIGTVAIFRSVRNHRFDGGSLNAYPGDCEGFKWFLPIDRDGRVGEGIDEGKVRALREWWVQEKKRERVEEEERTRERPVEGVGVERV
ncbi:MAG: hypothetical protein M1812_002511 [Candelaria pacifica]|nr:MAG: hypothetical protein M1812_002511 [Candelaria pacifica]